MRQWQHRKDVDDAAAAVVLDDENEHDAKVPTLPMVKYQENWNESTMRQLPRQLDETREAPASLAVAVAVVVELLQQRP